MGKRIFVSRILADDSPIRQAAGDGEVIDVSLIDFAAESFDDPLTDWVFFYSKNAVKFFFDSGDYALYPYQWAAMGPGTAAELEKYVIDISFVGDGDPESIASQFDQVLHPSESVTFMKAETSLDSIRKFLDLPESASTVVYSNRPKATIPSGLFDVLIFTSPMSVEVWMAHNAYQGEEVIAIGKTTASAAVSLGVKDVRLADSPSEVGIAELLSRILQ